MVVRSVYSFCLRPFTSLVVVVVVVTSSSLDVIVGHSISSGREGAQI